MAAAEASEGLGPQTSTIGLVCEGLLETRGLSHPRLRDLAPAHSTALQDSPLPCAGLVAGQLTALAGTEELESTELAMALSQTNRRGWCQDPRVQASHPSGEPQRPGDGGDFEFSLDRARGAASLGHA